MQADMHQKIDSRHLKRKAYLYVRQSTLRQVFENQESTKRQYALRDRAVALGWPIEQVVVIDEDLGRSGASATERAGFQRLVAEVGIGQAGIVMGLEVSRLARNSSDWHRLLEICALSDTLLLDEDGLYDPAHFNDRLVLGLKGTMSEAELHVLRARLQGGIRSKARRAELESPLPVGLLYDAAGRVAFDPDKQVQAAIRLFFQTFERTGTACATVKHFRDHELKFPSRVRVGANKGELIWRDLEHSRTLQILHNPRYAGAFFYGRSRQRKGAEGTGRFKKLPREEWLALVPSTHPGYIDWDRFEANQRQLLDNAIAHGADRRASPPREGPALLQGLVVCGRCGKRMTVRYHGRNNRMIPDYVCQREGVAHGGEPICQMVVGGPIDDAIGKLLLEVVSPLVLEVSLAVQRELENRVDETDGLRKMAVERARHQADLARRRYMRVDPDNRLVADSLEADWNAALRDLDQAQQEYEQRKQRDLKTLGAAAQAQILALATDFPRLWNDPATPDRERKRMVRLLIADVTLCKSDAVKVDVRFKAGATRSLVLARPLNAGQLRKTPAEVIAEVDRLLDDHTDAEVAELLKKRGIRAGTGTDFSAAIVLHVRKTYGLRSRYQRLRDRGMLTLVALAASAGVCTGTVKIWNRDNLLRSHKANDKNEYLFEPLGDDAPARYKWKGISARKLARKFTTNPTDEVQYEA